MTIEHVKEEIVEEEEKVVEKTVDEMTEDELTEHLEKQLGEPKDTTADKTVEEKPVADETTETEPAAEETVEGYTKEQLDELTPKERGILYDKEKQRHRAQDQEKRVRELELENTKIKAGQEATMKTMEMLRKGDVVESKSEYEQVLGELNVKAEAFEQESGEEYRPTLKETQRLEQARVNDSRKEQESKAQTLVENSRKEDAEKTKQRIATSIENIKKERDDFDQFESIVDKMINPKLATDESDWNDRIKMSTDLINSKNPGKAIFALALTTDEGQKLFKESLTKETNKEIIKDSDKQINKNSSHLSSTRSSPTGKYKLSSEEANKDFDKWYPKCTESQWTKICMGEDVYV